MKNERFWGNFLQNVPQKLVLWPILLILALFQFQQVQSQDSDESQEKIFSLLDPFFTNSGQAQEEYLQSNLDALLNAGLYKIDLNTVTAAELGNFGFFLPHEIDAILGYRIRNGSFIHIRELQAVRELRKESRELLRLISIADLKQKEMGQNSELPVSHNHELVIKTSLSLEKPQGFSPSPGTEALFKGSPLSYFVRYRSRFKSNQFGLSMEKDPGEKLFRNKFIPMPDFVSFFLTVDRPLSWIQKLHLGDYDINFGQGLISYNASGFFKNAGPFLLRKSSEVYRRYSSIRESGFKRGLAAEFGIKDKLNLYVHFFRNGIDASVNDENQVTGIQSSGLHRSPTELDKRNILKEFGSGFRLEHTSKYPVRRTIGLNFQSISYNKFFIVPDRPYKKFSFQGKSANNLSLDHDLMFFNTRAFGEIAIDQDGSIALIEGLIKSLHSKLDISLVYRHYGAAYYSPGASGFGEYGGTNNEKGLYFGIQSQFSPALSSEFYFDRWSHSWLRFGIDSPSNGYEYFFRLKWAKRKKQMAYLQLKLEHKYHNSSQESNSGIMAKKLIRLRLHHELTTIPSLDIKTRLERSWFNQGSLSAEGFLFYQDIIYSKTGGRLKLSGRFSYFSIADYEARIYSFENGMFYEYNLPFFTGTGFKYLLNVRYRMSSGLRLELKYSHMKYLKRTLNSFDPNTITSNQQNKISAQLYIRL